MSTFKNVIIAVLTGLLALTLLTQPAQSAGTSQAAKIVQYTVCLNLSAGANTIMENIIAQCAKYKP